jgi:hypothetical protein
MPKLFEKGNPGGGVRKGIPLKKTKELKSLIDAFCDNNFEQIEQDFLTLTPKERCQLYTALLQYRLPKRQSIEVEPIKPIPDEYKELSFDQLQRIQDIQNENLLLTNG